MLPAEIKDLINADSIEWERLELKEGYDRDDIVKAICAFANDINSHGGGYLVLGCKEEDGKPVLPPTGLPPNKVDDYQQDLRQVCHQLEPYYSPIIRPYNYDDKVLLLIYIPAGDARPYKAPKTQAKASEKFFYVRQGSVTAIANATERSRLLEQASKLKFESHIHGEATLEAINPELVRKYLRNANSILSQEADSMSLEELCNCVMISKGPTDALRPLNLGLLLFSDRPDKYFKGAIVEVAIFNDDDGTDIREEITFSGPIDQQIRDVLQFFDNSIVKSKVVKIGKQSREITNYPKAAIREAVVNAIYHKSYELDNIIEIGIYPSRLQFINFPGPMAPITEASLLQDRQIVHDYRNPILGAFLKDIGLAEKRATGLNRIKKALKINGSVPPAFDIGDQRTHFAVTIYQHPDWDDGEYVFFDNPPLDDIVVGIKVSQVEYVILEKGLEGATLDEIKKAMSTDVTQKEIGEAIDRLIDERCLTIKTIKKLFGIVQIKLYRITAKGQKVYQQSF